MAEASERSSVNRTRTRLRRWCTKQRVDRLLTLTFRDDALPADLDAAWVLMEAFRRLWAENGLPPIAIVPEWGERTGRFHFHGAFRGFVDVKLIERLWGHGFVHVSRHDGIKGESARSRERRLANYISVYVTKAAHAGATGFPPRDEEGPGAPVAKTVGKFRKRYSVPVGTHPRRTVVKCADVLSAWREAERLCSGGRRMLKVWSSADLVDWLGPDTIMLQDP